MTLPKRVGAALDAAGNLFTRPGGAPVEANAQGPVGLSPAEQFIQSVLRGSVTPPALLLEQILGKDTIVPKISEGAGKLARIPGDVAQGFVAAPSKALPKPMQENAAKFAAAKEQLGQQAQEDEFANLINQYTAPAAPPVAPQYAASAQTAPQTSDDILDLLKRRLVAQETPPSTLGLSEALAVFGRGMLDTEGEERDFFQQLGMGSKAVEKAQKERSDSAQEQMAKQMEQLADFLKTKAYIEQVEKQGQITPYQERTLQLENDKLAVALLRALKEQNGGDTMADLIRSLGAAQVQE